MLDTKLWCVGVCVQSEVPHELAQGKAFMAGTTKQGQPCVLMKGARHDARGGIWSSASVAYATHSIAQQSRHDLHCGFCFPAIQFTQTHSNREAQVGRIFIIISASAHNRSRYNRCRACVAGSTLQGSPLRPALRMAFLGAQRAVISSRHVRVPSVLCCSLAAF